MKLLYIQTQGLSNSSVFMAKEKEGNTKDDTAIKAGDHVKKCGIIMPIADNIGYPSGHWRDVLSIIEEAFGESEFTPSLVSKKDSIGLIHESIVTNIYGNEIVVCDVSTKNPNVMFELGMRLAFDKPIIIIKDEKADYQFDTGLIEHLNYPSSLRFQDIVIFKKELLNRAKATYEAAKDPSFSPYLRSFNKTIVPGRIENVEVTDLQYIVDSITVINSNVDKLTSIISQESIDSDMARDRASAVTLRKLRNNILEIAQTMFHKDIDGKTQLQLVKHIVTRLPKEYEIELGFDRLVNEVTKALGLVIDIASQKKEQKMGKKMARLVAENGNSELPKTAFQLV